ncbi:DHH family phosphoesterase [Helicobacter cappadocius]|uniref:3',5'-cyclic-nucleotide phosphodiesterase n=1 Tax=Helicobacter cappadocius TaxID=3063998 RepID=A0AA90PL61_9HELI|nr:MULTISPECIES: 3',5'-cyclic-nucleotide phosphodiesterase [unclassified Helicobacter]MDO7253562.1 3',5'-cyclic-nucleotide phosphodiesterase [Helicobacter sp. faydin-H75]MDP2539490.1 3',5'-cyclic-nucleotide phosphodiesterase [Helicobacter sp. faydin-H76]
MEVHHLSHIDLDGYGCQLISKHFFKNIHFYNANYGKEVMVRINSILDNINNSIQGKLESKFHSKSQAKFLILITDLNLSMQEAKYLQERVDENRLAGKDIEISLLDHHISGEESAKAYHWYYLDSNRCGTKITYETLKEKYPLINPEDEKWLNPMVEMINSVDIWQENGFGFEFGKVAMSMISNSNELNRFMFDTEHRDYKLKLLKEARNYLLLQKGEIKFDNEIFRLKKIALGGDPDLQTMDNIASFAQVNLLSQKKSQCSISYGDKKGFLSYSMGGISVLANLFLSQNPEFDYYIDVNSRGNVSLRANGKCDVSAMSKELFNGGGHKNASGGKIDGFRESFLYEDIKRQIDRILETSQA